MYRALYMTKTLSCFLGPSIDSNDIRKKKKSVPRVLVPFEFSSCMAFEIEVRSKFTQNTSTYSKCRVPEALVIYVLP